MGFFFQGHLILGERKYPPQKYLVIFPGLFRRFTKKENRIGSAVSNILGYRFQANLKSGLYDPDKNGHTDGQIDIL